MTITLKLTNRRRGLADKVLLWMGKKRRPMIPGRAINGLYASLGPYAYISINCAYQPFWRAIFNRREQ